jgi:hypothetical protein
MILEWACNMYAEELSERTWFEFWSHNQYYLSDGSFYQMKIPLEAAVQLVNKFWAEHIRHRITGLLDFFLHLIF